MKDDTHWRLVMDSVAQFIAIDAYRLALMQARNRALAFIASPTDVTQGSSVLHCVLSTGTRLEHDEELLKRATTEITTILRNAISDNQSVRYAATGIVFNELQRRVTHCAAILKSVDTLIEIAEFAAPADVAFPELAEDIKRRLSRAAESLEDLSHLMVTDAGFALTPSSG